VAHSVEISDLVRHEERFLKLVEFYGYLLGIRETSVCDERYLSYYRSDLSLIENLSLTRALIDEMRLSFMHKKKAF
jgi:hypothetical protein